jgi:signal transduction histidine kinase
MILDAKAKKPDALTKLTRRIAHELNNPLTAVLGFAELIAATSEETRVRADAHIIVVEALRMREIIQNLVQLPKVEAEATL